MKSEKVVGRGTLLRGKLGPVHAMAAARDLASELSHVVRCALSLREGCRTGDELTFTAHTRKKTQSERSSFMFVVPDGGFRRTIEILVPVPDDYDQSEGELVLHDLQLNGNTVECEGNDDQDYIRIDQLDHDVLVDILVAKNLDVVSASALARSSRKLFALLYENYLCPCLHAHQQALTTRLNLLRVPLAALTHARLDHLSLLPHEVRLVAYWCIGEGRPLAQHVQTLQFSADFVLPVRELLSNHAEVDPSATSSAASPRATTISPRSSPRSSRRGSSRSSNKGTAPNSKPGDRSGRLVRCPQSGEIIEIYWRGAGLTDLEIVALSCWVAAGALPHLRALNVEKNAVTDVGLRALGGAMAEGALPSLTKLSLRCGGRGVSDAGVAAFQAALMRHRRLVRRADPSPAPAKRPPASRRCARTKDDASTPSPRTPR